MAIDNINRNAYTRNVSAAVTLSPDDYIVIADATSAGFTITLTDFSDGAEHNYIIQVDPDDSSGNSITVSGNGGTVATLASDATTSVWLKTQQDGTWFVAGYQSTTSAATASSAAASAGLAASAANSTGVSGGTRASTADSKAVSDSTNISVAGSGVTSNSINISVADSKAVSNSVITSTLTTTTNSKITSQSLILSVTTSTANSG